MRAAQDAVLGTKSRSGSIPSAELEGSDGCPRFAPAYSGFPVELSGVGALHAAFLNESRTRGRWWSPVQEIRIPGPKKMGEAQRSLLINEGQTLSENLKWI